MLDFINSLGGLPIWSVNWSFVHAYIVYVCFLNSLSQKWDECSVLWSLKKFNQDKYYLVTNSTAVYFLNHIAYNNFLINSYSGMVNGYQVGRGEGCCSSRKSEASSGLGMSKSSYRLTTSFHCWTCSFYCPVHFFVIIIYSVNFRYNFRFLIPYTPSYMLVTIICLFHRLKVQLPMSVMISSSPNQQEKEKKKKKI